MNEKPVVCPGCETPVPPSEMTVAGDGEILCRICAELHESPYE